MGTFKFRCVFCRQKIEAQDEWDGMFAECPGCGRQIEVRRDDEFAVKPPHTRLAPVVPDPDPPLPTPPHPTFQKPFPPRMPRSVRPAPKAPAAEKTAKEEMTAEKATPPRAAVEKTAVEKTVAEKTVPTPPTMPEDRVREEKPSAPPVPAAPKPFPKPFTIDLPKWELPGKDGTKK